EEAELRRQVRVDAADAGALRHVLAQRVVRALAHGTVVVDADRRPVQRLAEETGHEEAGVAEPPEPRGALRTLLLQRFLQEESEWPPVKRAVLFTDIEHFGVEEPGQQVDAVGLGRLLA